MHLACQENGFQAVLTHILRAAHTPRHRQPIVEITDLKIADHFDLEEKPFFSFLPGVKKTIFEWVKKKIVTMVRWWTW